MLFLFFRKKETAIFFFLNERDSNIISQIGLYCHAEHLAPIQATNREVPRTENTEEVVPCWSFWNRSDYCAEHKLTGSKRSKEKFKRRRSGGISP